MGDRQGGGSGDGPSYRDLWDASNDGDTVPTEARHGRGYGYGHDYEGDGPRWGQDPWGAGHDT